MLFGWTPTEGPQNESRLCQSHNWLMILSKDSGSYEIKIRSLFQAFSYIKWNMMASCRAYLAAPCSRFSTLESARVLWSLFLFCRLPSTQPNDQNHQYNHWWRCRMASVYRTSPHATVRQDLCCGNAFFLDAACDWISTPSGSNNLINHLLVSCGSTCPVWIAHSCNHRYPCICRLRAISASSFRLYSQNFDFTLESCAKKLPRLNLCFSNRKIKRKIHPPHISFSY